MSATLEDDDWAGIESTLAPSTVELQLNTDNRSVLFFLNLKSGTFKYWKGFGRSAKEAELEIKDWVIALHVNLAFELKTTGFSDLPKNVQDRLKVLNNYSVQQLLIDFTSANIAVRDNSRSYIPIPPDDADAKSFFELFMNQYFTARAKETNDSIIHYLPRVNQPQLGYGVPTIPPTDLTFQNLPFVVSVEDKGKIGPNNMLVYLQMTQEHPLPRELLPVSANWVVPAPNDNVATYDGTVALSKGIFLDGWLMPKLLQFNKQSSWVTTEAWWHMDGIKVAYNLNGHMGRWDATDSDLKFSASSYNDVPSDVRVKVTDSDRGSWYKYYFDSRKDDDHDLFRVWMEGKTTNWVFVREGFNKNGKADVILIGQTRVDLYVHIDIPSSNGWVQGDWMIELIFDGVDEGDLKITTNPTKITPVITKGAHEVWLRDGDVTTFFGYVQDDLNQLSMNNIVSSLTSALRGSWDFCISGGQDFFIDKACFNREQDLLCQLVYKTKA